jgi:hypothetical protein
MSKYPVLKATMEELTKHLSFDFQLIWDYSGSHDSGWFDGFRITDAKGKGSDSLLVANHITAYIQEHNEKIEHELYALLESRFPGWEIGCDDVNGSNGSFIIKSSTMAIEHTHTIDYCTTEDASPEEVEPL